MSGNCQNCLHWGLPTAKTGDPVQLVGKPEVMPPGWQIAAERLSRQCFIS